jgi:hypothetical protein
MRYIRQYNKAPKKTRKVEILRSDTPHYFHINCYSPPVHTK